MRLTLLWIIAATSALLACSKKAPEQQAVAAPVAELPKLEALPESLHGTRKLRGLDLPVYVDGAQTAVLRYGEVPKLPNRGTALVPSYRLYDYLKAIGIAPERVKTIQIHDFSDRIASVDGTELTQNKDRFVFHFASGTTGVAETGWDTVGLKNGLVVHEMRKMNVLVTKEPPARDKDRLCVVVGGRCSEEVAFQQAPPAKGTRVYLDGHLAGVVKRRIVTGAPAQSDKADDRAFSLAELTRSFGVDVAGLRAVEFVSGDDVVGRAGAEAWTRHARDMSFTLAPHQHGKIRVRVPAEMQAQEGTPQDRDALITAVLLFRSMAPVQDRPLTSISEGTDMSAQLASNSEGDVGGWK
jgi:hypothetical protein